MTGTFVESGASFALVPRLTPSKAEDTGGGEEVLELRVPRTGWNYKDCGRQGVRMVVGLDNNFKR